MRVYDASLRVVRDARAYADELMNLWVFSAATGPSRAPTPGSFKRTAATPARAMMRFARRVYEDRRARTVLVVMLALAATGAAASARSGEDRRERRARARRRREILAEMAEAETYEAFEDAAIELERFDAEEEERRAASGEGELTRGGWGSGSRTYDVDLIDEQLRQLQAQRAAGNVEEMMFLLRADILRNLGSLDSSDQKVRMTLSGQTHGVPRAVRQYMTELKSQLISIAQDETVTIQEKLVFLQETRHCFGRTALMMSGGGTLGTFHIGVARALNRKHLLPRVLAGSSVGSIIAAIIGSRTQEELDEFLRHVIEFF